ncbi:hypothetical protein B0H14DRAFT_3521071 [Mycena olivaceomarginata]|nr:hypothetical protein B0H14DRAFT_3521071 [Mycena olivaceomarginata]
MPVALGIALSLVIHPRRPLPAHAHCTYSGYRNGSPAVIQRRGPKLHPLNPHPPSAAPFSRSLPALSAPSPPPPAHLQRFVSCGHAELLMPMLGASPHRRTAASFACYAFHTGPLHAVPIPHAQTIP